MGKLEPGNSGPTPERAKPAFCARCNTSTVVNHCETDGCRWVRCKTCKAVTGIIATFGGDGAATRKWFLGWKRMWFGGEDSSHVVKD